VSKRIAVVGAGYFAQFHVQGWQAAGATVVAICDTDVAKAQAMSDRLGIGQVFGDARAMIDAVAPDLVDVVLPPSAQAPVVSAALAQGIPTVCQKPFGADMAEAIALTEEAERRHTPLVIHENFRFSPWFRECKRLIDAGHFGRIHGITFRLRTGDGQGPDAYIERQPYFQKMPQLLIRETGVHYVDTFRYLMGDVVAVTARLRRLNPHIAGEDAGLVIFEFADDRQGLFDGNRLNDHPSDNPRTTMGEMWLEGERGVMRLDGNARLWWKPHHCPEAEHAYSPGTEGPFGGACTALQAHVLSHLQHGTPLENGARSYLDVSRVQEAIYFSHVSGRRVPLATFHPTTPANNLETS
jgi:predicted dehydrogenase